MTLQKSLPRLIVVALAFSSCRGTQDSESATHDSAIETTKSRLIKFEDGLALYKLKNRRYPDRVEQLVPKYLTHLPTDGWGNAFIYERIPGSQTGMRLRSYGADGVPGGTGENADLWLEDQ